jgi:hypothetical protein
VVRVSKKGKKEMGWRWEVKRREEKIGHTAFPPLHNQTLKQAFAPRFRAQIEDEIAFL